MEKQNIDLLEEMMYKRNFHHVFQPLYNLDTWEVSGFEALLRSDLIESPDKLFNIAIHNNMLYELDIASVYHALDSASKRSSIRKLFINVFPSTMVNPQFLSFLEKMSHHRCSRNKQIIFEMNEAEKFVDTYVARKVIDDIKGMGYGIAIDDYGKGEASIESIVNLEPDIIKVDQQFSKNLFSCMEKQSEIKMLVQLCEEKQMKLVLEGIEDERDLATAKILGVHIGQGFLLGKPQSYTNFYLREGNF
ncbi:EAL domain-containing protein [Oceanobacillus halotolerans]|uniref:EAL domain-containing protein n=1 Tax=Oceanobacillus halotolerans TaxID=2663380 RepID=UPI0013DCE1CE|nr:EAL domain-containing protein [Oceanobacillus halotolerans]